MKEDKAKNNSGYLYFVLDHNNEYVKIGRTKNLQSRLSQLQTSTWHTLSLLYQTWIENDVNKYEKGFHDFFQNIQVKNEWYDFSLFKECDCSLTTAHGKELFQLLAKSWVTIDIPWFLSDQQWILQNCDQDEIDKALSNIIPKFSDRKTNKR
jgi:hypothetical protein